MSDITDKDTLESREEEERRLSVQAMVAKETDKNCIKSSDYHLSDRVKAVGGLMKHKASEISHQHKADKEHDKMVEYCDETNQPVEAHTTTAPL